MKKLLILTLIIAFNPQVFAITEIPLPDMSNADTNIVKRHDELIASFKQVKDKKEGIQLGTVYGELGMFYQAHEFTNAAQVCYKNAIEVSPFDYRWKYLLAFIQASLGLFDEAKSLYESVLKINADYLPAKIRWAKIELDTGNFSQARKLYQEVLEIAPDFSKALVGLGTLSLQENQPKKAIEYLEQAQKLQPSANQLNFLLSQAYAALGQDQKAQDYLKNKGNRTVIMFDKILQEMRLYSVSASYYAQAAINAFLNKDFPLSEQLVNHSIELDPKNANPKFTLMNIYLSTDRTEKAIELAKSLLKDNQNDDRIPYNLGLINEINGNDKEAILWYQKTLTINKTHKTAQIALANALMRTKQFNEALKILRESQVVDSQNPYTYFSEASILSYLKVCDKAIDKYMQAIKKHSGENLTYLVGFVKTVAMCDVKDDIINSNALNAAKNMYLYSPTFEVVQAFAMLEASLGHKTEAVDYQAQAIFQALTQGASKQLMAALKADMQSYEKGGKATQAIKPFDLDINPKRANSINN